MLTSITPLGERGRASRWSVTTTAYVVGSVLGGTALGAVLGGAGSVLPLDRTPVAGGALVLLAALATAGLVVELRGRPRLRWPARQVDEDWLHRYRGWVYGLGYGLQLGVGVVTIITSATFFVLLALLILTGSAAGGALVGAVFGLTRALPVLGLRSVHSAPALAAAARRVEALAPVARGAAAAALSLVAVAATTALVTGGVA